MATVIPIATLAARIEAGKDYGITVRIAARPFVILCVRTWGHDRTRRRAQIARRVAGE